MASKQQHEEMVRAPEGFRRTASVANAGWFNHSKIGNLIHGTLEGMYERNDTLRGPKGKSTFYQIKLLSSCEVRMGTGEDVKMVTAQAGEFVNLNEGPRTKVLGKEWIPKVAAGAEVVIWGPIVSGKIKLKDGRTMHNLDLHVNMTRPPKALDDGEADLEDGFQEAEGL